MNSTPMYTAFFGLSEKPFAITPDPRYLFLSGRHADALAHLIYGINEAGGFIQLTGEVGTGKTTTIRSLLARAPKDAEIALILNPRLSASEFLRSLCEELGLGTDESADGSTKDLVDVLNRYLLRAHAQGRRVVLIVDEAQNLEPEVLEQIRLLTNLETETQKLLQIILIGQPELRQLLAREDLRQLAQRVTGRYHLDPLSREETAAYVRHRLRVAGATSDIFTGPALREVFRVSRGIPRVINIVCDRALLGAYTQDMHEVPAVLVRRAGAEVFGREITAEWLPWVLGGLASVLLLASAVLYLNSSGHGRPAMAGVVGAAGPAAGSVAADATGQRGVVRGVIVPAAPVLAPNSVNGGVSTAPVADSLATLLQHHHGKVDIDSAFVTLFGLWHATYQSGGADGCTQARGQGLQCFAQRGALAQLRLFNRPAILLLNDSAGNPYEVVLRSLDDSSMQLQFGDQLSSVGIADLSRYWFGDFVLLWNPGATEARNLNVGMHGERVRHLRQQLQRWRGAADIDSTSDQYDQSMVHLVEAFQRASLLNVDGVAGVETQVALDAALAVPGSPVLQQRAARVLPSRGD